MKKVLLLLLSAWFTTLALAATETVNGITWTYSVSNGTATIGAGAWEPAISSSTSGAITIPSALGGYPVTSIGDYAFYGCSRLTSVTIPEGVTNIWHSAFEDCLSLISVTIPEGVTLISDRAFCDCSALTSVTIPSSVKWIGELAFYGCKGLTSITIPEGVNTIEYATFSNCGGLTSVTIPESVTSIGDYAFYGCSSLYKDAEGVQYESKAKIILMDVPISKTGTFEIPSSVRCIHSDAFSGCSSLTSVTIPEGVTTIGSSAFYNCSSLTSVKIPKAVTTIGDSAFHGCRSLTSITIPESVTSIGDWAFSYCYGLTSVAILSQVPILGSINATYIGCQAFYDCINLTSVKITSSNFCVDEDAFYGVAPTELTANSFPGGSMTSTKLKKVIIPDGSNSIEDNAFSGCSSLTSVTIPEGVTTIGSRAFYGCSRLTTVTFPSSVTSIRSYAFYNCSSLTSIVFIGEPPSIGNETFNNISATGYYLHAYAEQWQSQLDTNGKWCGLTMKELVGEQYSLVFDANGGEGGGVLTQRYETPVTPPTVTREGYTFVRWNPTPPVTMPINDFKTYVAEWKIDEACFEVEEVAGGVEITQFTHPTLADVVIPAQIDGKPVVSIGMEAFADCTHLRSVTIPEGVTLIKDYAFYGCEGLTSITIPASITSIGRSAFEACAQLGRFSFNGVPPAAVGSNAFKGIASQAIGVYDSSVATAWEGVIVDAQWKGLKMQVNTAVEVTLTFDANGGEGSTNLTQTYGSPLTAPTMTREGYTLAGWSPEVPATTPEQDTVYTAYWIRNVYVATFDANGGKGGQSLILEAFAPLSAPTVTREGYTFVEWSPTVPATVPAGNTTYKAQWKVNQYTQTFDANGGEGGTSVTQDYTSSLVAPTVTREGYTLVRWLPAVPTTVPAENVTYTAQWKFTQYTMTFDANGGEGGTSVTQDYTSSLVAPEVTREGYTFVGWLPEVPVTVPIGDRTYTAQWTPTQRAITFDANGGEGGVCKTQPSGSPLTPPVVTHPKYVFMGWWPEVPEITPTRDTTYVAQWGSDPALFTYEVRDGEVTITGLAEGVTETDIIIPRWIEELPVTMIGNGAFSNNTALKSVIVPEGVITIGRSAFQNCTELETVTLASSVDELVSYAFAGCTHLTTIYFKGNPPSFVGKDVFSSVTAKGCYLVDFETTWAPEIVNGVWNGLMMERVNNATYTFTFDANGGEGSFTVTLNYGTKLFTPTVTREGYTFTGWSPEVPQFVPTENATYTAQWKVNQYTITFDANGGEGGTVVTQDYASTLTAPNVTREGYTFTGWSPAVPKTVPAANTTYTAQWKVNQYTMTFNANGGVGGKTVTQNCGSALTAPAVTREGYTFTGWLPAVPKTVPAANMTYTAQWEALPRYEVVVNVLGDGIVSGMGSYWGGAMVTLTATPNDGAVFCGWSTTPVTASKTYTFTMPEEAVNLTAYFAPAVAVESYVSGNNLKTEAEVSEAIETHVTINNLMSKEAAVQAALAAKEVYTADELQKMGEVAFDTPVITVEQGTIELAVKFKSAESLSAEWQAMVLKDAVLTVDEATGEVRVSVKKPDNLSGSFYKFVVDKQSAADEAEDE